MDVTIAVATFGDDGWVRTAEEVALPSAESFGVPVVHCHRDTLYGARNACLDEVCTEMVIYLDADDELEYGYLAAMVTASADIRVPQVRYVRPGQSIPSQPVMPKVAGHSHRCRPACLVYGNWIVIGAAARTDLLREVGGWRDYGWEDWDLWLRCHLAGASIQAAPPAVYRAYVRPESRGRYSPEESLAHHRAVAQANGVPVP